MLSFVTLIAYDFEYAFHTIKSYYDIADEIILGLDHERRSFSGTIYPFDEDAFKRGLATIDRSSKIKLVEGDFHSQAHPLANEWCERHILVNHCKPGNWVIQIDSDEILLNPVEFAHWIHSAPPQYGVNAQWLCIFKSFGQDVLIIREPQPYIAVGSKQRSDWIGGRQTRQTYINSPLILLHNAYGRERADVELKIRNWGHSREINHCAFMQFWDQVTLENYADFRNFHPLHAPWWASLELVKLSEKSGFAAPAV